MTSVRNNLDDRDDLKSYDTNVSLQSGETEEVQASFRLKTVPA